MLGRLRSSCLRPRVSRVRIQIGWFEAQMNQLEPFMTEIVEANEQARMKIKAQDVEIAGLSSQLADANKTIDKLTHELLVHASRPVASAHDCPDAPQEAATTQAPVIDADSADVSTELAVFAPEIAFSLGDDADSALDLHSAASIASSPVEFAEKEESEDDDSFGGDDQEDEVASEHDDIEDFEAFQQYVFLEDADTKEWTVDNKDVNASAFTVVSDVITSDVVGCVSGGLLTLKTAERSPQLLARLGREQGAFACWRQRRRHCPTPIGLVRYDRPLQAFGFGATRHFHCAADSSANVLAARVFGLPWIGPQILVVPTTSRRAHGANRRGLDRCASAKSKRLVGCGLLGCVCCFFRDLRYQG